MSKVLYEPVRRLERFTLHLYPALVTSNHPDILSSFKKVVAACTSFCSCQLNAVTLMYLEMKEEKNPSFELLDNDDKYSYFNETNQACKIHSN